MVCAPAAVAASPSRHARATATPRHRRQIATGAALAVGHREASTRAGHRAACGISAGRAGAREDSYSPRRAAPGGGRSRRAGERPGGSGAAWSDPGTARGRSVSRFGTGVRDIRDDLRERLRRNGVRGDWDTPDARPRRQRGGDRGGPGGPDGGEPRRKGSWWRHWTWKKALTIVAGLIGGVVMLAAAGVAYAYSKTPIPDVQSTVMQQASKVYFSDGKTQVGQFG